MIQVLAPAKINLGLEIVGRRGDGYHEIRTIFCAVSLFDRVTVRASEAPGVTCDGVDDSAPNLAATALGHARAAHPNLPPVSVDIRKRIPMAAGLGGASSDAAATLLALRQTTGLPFSSAELGGLALRCGSDVPFFLKSGIAYGKGRGEDLSPLPVTPIHAVIVTPQIAIPDKTRSMYAHISPADWSNGEQVEMIAATLRRRVPLPITNLLPNAFRQPLYDRYPEIRALADRIGAIADRAVQVSGAGPSLFTLCTGVCDAMRIRQLLIANIAGEPISIHRVRSVSTVLATETTDD